MSSKQLWSPVNRHSINLNAMGFAAQKMPELAWEGHSNAAGWEAANWGKNLWGQERTGYRHCLLEKEVYQFVKEYPWCLPKMTETLVKRGVRIFKSFASVYCKQCFSQSYGGSKKISGWGRMEGKSELVEHSRCLGHGNCSLWDCDGGYIMHLAKPTELCNTRGEPWCKPWTLVNNKGPILVCEP